MGAVSSKKVDKENHLIAQKTGFTVAQVQAWRRLFMV